MLQRIVIILVCLLFSILTELPIYAGVIEYNLEISQEDVNITGKPVPAMTINGTIPGPTLSFREGDTAHIHVHNKMKVDSSIHWHGILVPPGMDGVPYVSFPPIEPNTTFTYEFPIRQSGTYWYHSHTSLQEQSGVYGSIVIEPERSSIKSDRDYVVLLSDWTDENPHTVNQTLKRGSEWYAIEKGSGQSILGAMRLGMFGDYFKRELQRMPPMDIADVAYDRFLANGKPVEALHAKPGDTVRLRIIDGSATTYFNLQYAGGPMSIIAADGIDVEPVEEHRFLIGVAETYDVLIQVPESGSYELRATAHDGSAHASVWIGSGMKHYATEVPRPNLYHNMMSDLSWKRTFALTPAGSMAMPDAEVDAGHFDKPGMMGMGSMDIEGAHRLEGMNNSDNHAGMQMNAMEHGPDSGMKGSTMKMDVPDSQSGNMMHHSTQADEKISPASRSGKNYGTNFRFLAADVASSQNLAVDGMNLARPWPPYDKLRSTNPTSFDKDRSVREIRLTLDGDMERYVWFLNNRPLSESDSILIHEGEVTRFIMINRTMMHHPMHLHGHFFRVINGQGDHAPLKHTVDVAPTMSTTVIEFDANEFGDWFFHCHLLYHMKSGMARVVHYENYDPGLEVAAIRPNLFKDSWYFWGEAEILSNMTEGFLTTANIRNMISFSWEVGWHEVEETEWEGLIKYSRYINRFFSLFAGVDLLGEEDELDETRGVAGIHYLLPLNIESQAWVDTDGGARFMLEKSLELTPRFSLSGEAEYDTHEQWEGGIKLAYMLAKNFSLIGKWHSEYSWGGGLAIRF